MPFTVSIKLDDSLLNTIHTFNVEVYNEPPVFTTPPASMLTVKLSNNYVYTLPPYSDPQNNSVTVTVNSVNPVALTFVKVATD
jgi:hypothetical protein